jgi:hypothetical protein
MHGLGTSCLEEDEMIAAKFEEMIDRIKMWGGVFYP